MNAAGRAACDVAVVGGGPGGCATALALRAHAPSLAVVLAEATEYAEPRIGETLPPPAAALLDHLGAWDAFAAQRHRPAYGTVAAWGTPEPYDNDFLFGAHGAGWHLDRAAFDSMLAERAESRGTCVLRGTRVTDAERTGDGWRLRLSSGDAIDARWVVDATGAGAGFARRHGGATTCVEDRLVGFCRFFREAEPADPRTLVEAFADGWWYTAGLPDGRRVAVCMTDADVARELELETDAGWFDALADVPCVAGRLREAKPDGEPVVREARSRRLDPAAGEGWIAVGDAASTFDPLSSQGVLKALRSGVYAAYAVGDRLARGDDAGLRRYRAFVAREFEAYLATRARFYAEERRWPERPFWRRRRSSEPVAVPA